MAFDPIDLTKGLRPIGTPKTELVREYDVSASSAEIGVGDFVTMTSGEVTLGSNTSDADDIIGAVLGHADATTASQKVAVCIDPQQLYTAILGTIPSVASAKLLIGQYFKLRDVAAAKVNGYSQLYVDGSTAAASPTDADFHVQLVDIDDSVSNDFADAAGEVRVIVRFTNPKFAPNDAITV